MNPKWNTGSDRISAKVLVPDLSDYRIGSGHEVRMEKRGKLRMGHADLLIPNFDGMKSSSVASRRYLIPR